jgi:hypothetical protein
VKYFTKILCLLTSGTKASGPQVWWQNIAGHWRVMCLTPNIGERHKTLHFRGRLLPVSWTRNILFCTFKFLCIFERLPGRKIPIYISEFSTKITAKFTYWSSWDKKKVRFCSLVLFFKWQNYQCGEITHLCWCNWRTFWRKNAAGKWPNGSYSCTTMLRLTGHLHPRRKWPTWVQILLFSGSSPVRLPSDTWAEKKNFRPTWRSLLPRWPVERTTIWIYFWVACTRYSNGIRSVLSFVGSMVNKSRVWSL